MMCNYSHSEIIVKNCTGSAPLLEDTWFVISIALASVVGAATVFIYAYNIYQIDSHALPIIRCVDRPRIMHFFYQGMVIKGLLIIVHCISRIPNIYEELESDPRQSRGLIGIAELCTIVLLLGCTIKLDPIVGQCFEGLEVVGAQEKRSVSTNRELSDELLVLTSPEKL
jgi:hypothetical protein